MKAVVWTGGEDFETWDVPEPTPRPEQVVVKVEAAAVCGTDFHYADFKSNPPIIPGHEVVGVIVEKNSEVNNLAIGQAVALDPVQRCGICYACTHGIGHLCKNTRQLGGEHAAGGWAEYVAVDVANAYPVPEGVSLVAAALSEPAAVCCQSFQRARFQSGQDVLVLGDGPFGFLHAIIARILGANTLIVAGHYDERLQRIASQTGAITCNTHRRDVVEIINEKTNGLGVDVAIDATGVGAGPDIGIAALRPRGTLVIFSYIWNPQPPDFGAVSLKELNLVGSSRSQDCFPRCLQWLAEGKLPTEKLVDLQLPLSQFDSAFRKLRERKKDLFKAVLLPSVGQSKKFRNG
jgi:threonine dehydrogenase-like Zn-dependent dehydrogenase